MIWTYFTVLADEHWSKIIWEAWTQAKLLRRQEKWEGVRCWWSEGHGAVICGCAVVFIGQQVGIIFSLGASCLGPARPTASSRSRVGVDGVSAVTHATHGVLPMIGDTTTASPLPSCGYFELLNICLLSPDAHQKWIQCIGHYTFNFLLLPLVFSP